MSKAAFLWLDLEMTGLNPEQDRIIEVGAIVTDAQLQELDSFHAIIKQPSEVLQQMNEWATGHHEAAGLLEQIPHGLAEPKAEAGVVKLVQEHFNEPVILAGNSIHMDRRFIRQWWPELERKLHYRMLDVSAWKVYFQARWKLNFVKAEKHRALEDIRESIAELQHYLNFVQVK